MTRPVHLVWLFVLGYLAVSALAPQSIGCSALPRGAASAVVQVVSR